jgi:predicted permease
VRGIIQDIRYAVRVSLKSPAFTAVAVLTLAIGIAANTTVFTWIDSVLLRPIPGVTAPASLAAFETVTPSGEFVTTSYEDFRDYRDHLTLLDGLLVAQPRTFSLGDREGVDRVWGELVSGNFFSVLGVKPLMGRVFSPDEFGDKQGAYPVAVLSYGLWQRKFLGDPGVIGRTVRVNRQQLTVIGVVPENFRGVIPGLTFEMWVPAMMGTQLNLMPDWMMKDRQTRSFISVARLKPGVTLPQARAEIASVSRTLAGQYPATNQGMKATVMPIWQGHFGSQSALLAPLQILMAVCGLVLLIVCANVANLLLARATSRQREFSLRLALGASRSRLVRQLLTESLLLALVGGALAIPLALWLGEGLSYLVPPTAFPIVIHVQLNGDILLFTMLVCFAACVLSGLAPAWQTGRTELNRALAEGGRGGSSGAASQKMRGLLVASEVALALVAIIGAGLFARSFDAARKISPGFDPAHVLVSHLYPATSGYSLEEQKHFCQRLRERLEAQSGVEAVAYADAIPLGFSPGAWEDLQIEGYVPGPAENMKLYRNVVAPGYLRLMRIRLLEGRDFTELDDLKSNPVMIVTQAFVRRFLGSGSPVGRRVHGWGKWFTVVGVAADSKYHTVNEAPMPYFYVPFRQVFRQDLEIAFYVRVAGDPANAIAMMRREVQSMDPSVGVFDAMPLTESIGASLFPQKVGALLLGMLGLIALVLAAAGLYSVMAYSISQRTQEIGIRMALGAGSGDVLLMVLRQGMAMTLAGLVVGAAGAVAVTRLAAGALIGVSATDPQIFVGGVLFLALVAASACYLPARRATRIDPNVALRWQ